MSKKVIIIAGPNGAGKTTFARSFLPAEAHCPRFINADLIAAGLAPFAPETAAVKAGRLMLAEMAECTTRGDSFAVETTLSGLMYLRHIHQWRQQVYLSLLILIPLSAVFLKTFEMDWARFVEVVTAPQVVATYKLSFGASLLAAAINALFGLMLAWALVRYRFPGKRRRRHPGQHGREPGLLEPVVGL